MSQTYDEFLLKVTQRITTHRSERYGQAWFNVLAAERPDLSERIRGGSLDPFYTGVTRQLTEYVLERW